MQEINTEGLKQKIENKKNGEIFIDVRELDEYSAGHIPGVIHIPLNTIAEKAEELAAFDTVYVSCGGGARSAKACELLLERGISIVNVSEGFRGWTDAGLDIEK